MTLTPPALDAAPGKTPQALWDELLGRYVRPNSTGLNRVDYAAWKASAGDMRALDAVVAGLAGGGLRRPCGSVVADRRAHLGAARQAAMARFSGASRPFESAGCR